jgi:hypothetical protein
VKFQKTEPQKATQAAKRRARSWFN